MNPIILSALTTAIASVLASFAVKVGWDATTTMGVAGAIAAGILAFAIGVWKAMQHSQNAVISAVAKSVAADPNIAKLVVTGSGSVQTTDASGAVTAKPTA